jgi:hypothetical protein
MNYSNLYYRDTLSEKKEKPGFETTKANRSVILGELEEAIRKREIIIWDKDVIKQLYSFIMKDGKSQAQQGAHDDAVIALAIANHLVEHGGASNKLYASSLSILHPVTSKAF